MRNVLECLLDRTLELVVTVQVLLEDEHIRKGLLEKEFLDTGRTGQELITYIIRLLNVIIGVTILVIDL